MAQKYNLFKIKDIVNFLLKKYPLNTQEKWDNSHIINWSCMNDKLKNIALGIDLFSKHFKWIIKNNVNLIITHHPLYLEKSKINSSTKELIKKLKKHRIVFLPLHTPFDLANDGTSVQLLKLLDLKNIYTKNGYLAYGVFDKFLTNKMLLKLVAKKINNKTLMYHFANEKKIRKIVLCSGSGYSLNNLINWAQADVFLTGDLDYHDWIDVNEKNISVIDIGHESENIIASYFKKLISKQFKINCKCLPNICLYKTWIK